MATYDLQQPQQRAAFERLAWDLGERQASSAIKVHEQPLAQFALQHAAETAFTRCVVEERTRREPLVTPETQTEARDLFCASFTRGYRTAWLRDARRPKSVHAGARRLVQSF